MFENLILALVGFGLGVLTTVITQIMVRYFRDKDERNAHRIKQLQIIREWMEAERALFRVKYPDLFEFVFCNITLVENAPFYSEKTPEILYTAMKQYLEAREKVEDAERKGNLALRSLDNQWFYKIPFVGGRALVARQFGEYPTGFPKKISPFLSLLGEMDYKVFNEFPGRVTRWIEWDKLPFINPSEIKTIIEPRINYFGKARTPNEAEKEAELGNLRDRLPKFKFDAETAIDSVLEIIGEYEKKWL